MGKPNDPSHCLVDQGRTGLGFEEYRVSLKQRWVEMLKDGRKVNGLIFNAYMVTVDGDGAHCEPQ